MSTSIHSSWNFNLFFRHPVFHRSVHSKHIVSSQQISTTPKTLLSDKWKLKFDPFFREVKRSNSSHTHSYNPFHTIQIHQFEFSRLYFAWPQITNSLSIVNWQSSLDWWQLLSKMFSPYCQIMAKKIFLWILFYLSSGLENIYVNRYEVKWKNIWSVYNIFTTCVPVYCYNMLPHNKPNILPLESDKLLIVPKRKYGLASPVQLMPNSNLRAQRKWSAPPLGSFSRRKR